MGWGYWPHYEPARPKPVKNGIKTKNERGAIGETWWSKRWIHVLESLGMGARLDRGRSMPAEDRLSQLMYKRVSLLPKSRARDRSLLHYYPLGFPFR